VQASELNYFKEILESRKKQIETNLSSVNIELNELSNLDLKDEGDHASVNNKTQELKEIKKALLKIVNGGYGVCEMCEDDIGFQRLKVKPHAIYCIDCREIVEKSN